MQSWLNSECERLAKEPTKTITKILSRLAKCYNPIPVLRVNELTTWLEIEKYHKNCNDIVEYEELDEDVSFEFEVAIFRDRRLLAIRIKPTSKHFLVKG